MSAPTSLAAYGSLVCWDWRREMLRKNTLLAMGMMGLITLFLFSFAMPTSEAVLAETRAGILWVTFLLAATIGIDRAFRDDGVDGLLEGLLLAPIARPVLYYAKVTSTFTFVVALQVVLLVLFLVLFDQSVGGAQLAGLAGAALAVDLAFVAAGVLVGAMTWSLPGGDVLLRILLFPLLLPVFAIAVGIADRAFDGEVPTLSQIGTLVAVDLVFLGAGHLLFEHLVHDVGSDA